MTSAPARLGGSRRPPLPGGVAARVLRSAAELEALAPAWAALWARCPGASPFQAPEWLLPWWRQFGEGTPFAVALHARGDDGASRLVGLAPLYVYAGDGARRLLPIGIGISDHLDALLDPTLPPDTADALLAALIPHAAEFSRVELPLLPPDSPLRRARAPAGWRDATADDEPHLVLELPAPRRPIWKSARYARRQLEREGTVTLATADAGSSAAEVLDALEGLLALHAARWRARGEAGVLDDPAVQRFHRDAAPGLARRGLLRLHVLRVADRTAAAGLVLRTPRWAASYITGFAPALERASPGTVLLGHAIAAAEGDGAAEFDFLRGLEPYKRRWGAVERPTARRVLVPG
ncbi:MAG TPA: GNAT family N-acetyltransferase [Gemmatimonadales bacterium]|nr:GNAT family N-acetyltransferase [Gemmatimonadales bacterium]